MTTHPKYINKEGIDMKAKNLTEVREAAEKLFEFKQKKAELEKLIADSEGMIKGYMTDKNKTELVVGSINIKYKPIISNRLNTTAFKDTYPDLYKSLCEEQTSYRLYVKPY